MKKLLLFVSILSFSLIVNGQNAITHRTCGTPQLPDEYEIWMQAKIQEYLALQQTSKVQTFYNIPVVVHVINSNEAIGTATNISVAQINSQIAVLNEDFRKLNADSVNTPVVFKPFAADLNVNFHLATVDPNGNTTTGIDRISYQSKGWNAPGSGYTQTYINGTIKPGSIWNTTQYLNIWVLRLGNGLLGYATFPPQSTLSGLSSSGSATTDGVVVLYNAFGRTGPGVSGLLNGYDRGRTATHEVGHYLGLRHISGDNACATDYCMDTPAQTGGFAGGQGGLNWGCPTPVPFHVGTCAGTPSNPGNPNGEMFMNFMDYVDDDCYSLYTNDQKTRVQTALANSPMRNQLSTGVLENTSRLQGVSIYPNPSKGQITISAPSLNYGSVVEINVINILGKTVYQQQTLANSEGTYSINLSALNSGLYIVELRNEKGVAIQRLNITK